MACNVTLPKEGGESGRADPLPILPACAAGRFPMEMGGKRSALLQGGCGGGQPPLPGFIPKELFYSDSLARHGCSKCRLAALPCCSFPVKAMGGKGFMKILQAFLASTFR